MLDILVVEDDAQTLNALVTILTRDGHAVRGAITAQIALLELDVLCPDVLISDWDLGDHVSGVQVVTQALRLHPDLKVVMVTGNNIARLQRETQELTIHRYLKKPYTPQDIRAVLTLPS